MNERKQTEKRTEKRERTGGRKKITRQERLRREKIRRARRRKKRIRMACGLLFLLVLAGGALFAVHQIRGIFSTGRIDELLADSGFEEYAEELKDIAKDHSKEVITILENRTEYPDKIIELLVKNPETLEFVLDYPKEKDAVHDADITKDYQEGEIPLFIQWDKRWGYDSYGSGMLAIDGCGPTCLSMVYTGLTGNTDKNPKAMADYSVENGYITEEAATKWDLMTAGAEGLGLSSKELSLDETIIKRELTAGNPIICSMGPGDFTSKGHFIVLTGVTKDGKITVNDPNSRIRSEKTWDLDTLMSQMKNLWAIAKA